MAGYVITPMRIGNAPATPPRIQKRNRLDMNTKIKTDERVKKLVKAIGGEVAPRRQLIADLGLRQESRRNFYRNYMYPARDRGLVVMEFFDVPSKPEQAYKLTEKGLAYWEELKHAEEECSKKEQAVL